MRGREVVISGYGCVTPFGNGVGTLMSNLTQGKDAVCWLGDAWNSEVDGTYCRVGAPFPGDLEERAIPRQDRRSMGRDSILATLAAKEALEMAGLSPPGRPESERMGVAFGSAMASSSSLEAFFRQYLVDRSVRSVPANGFFRVMGNSVAANVAETLGFAGRVCSTPGACASGTMAVGTGYEAIRSGVQDLMICGGVEELHPAATAIFDIVGAASYHFNDRPDLTPAPFDRDRDGTVCGEAAGAIILESAENASRRGAPILGRVLGYASNAGSPGLAQPGPEAMGRCVRAALVSAGLSVQDIDYVNAHATGTERGDVAEARALGEVFGRSVPVSSLKGALGHTLGASGAVETIATLEMMRGGFVLPTWKLRNVDERCMTIQHVREKKSTSIGFALKCSFGFGDANAVIVLGRK